MKTEEAGKAFLDHCDKERHLSRNTLDAYAQDIGEFRRFFPDVCVTQLGGGDIVGYAAHLLETRRLAPATVRRRLACLRSMFKWLTRRSVIVASPFSATEIRVRLPDRLPRCISRDDMALLAAAADAAGDAAGLATLLLLITGARVSELASLNLSDVGGNRDAIRIVGKGDRERQVFVPEGRVSDILDRHVEGRRRAADSDGPLFIGRSGNPLSAASIRRIVRRLSRSAGIPSKVTPHVLRHTAATALLEAGVDMRFVQRLLGHRSIVTTQIYTHVSDTALKAAVAAAAVCGQLPRRPEARNAR